MLWEGTDVYKTCTLIPTSQNPCNSKDYADGFFGVVFLDTLMSSCEHEAVQGQD